MFTQRLFPLAALLLLLPARATRHPAPPQAKAATPVVETYDEKDHIPTLADLPAAVRDLPRGSGRSNL